jgi:hypothetical protein
LETLYDQYKKHDYHILNIKDIEWGTLLKGANYYNILFNPKTKEEAFALFVRIVGSYWVGEMRNYNQMSFTNTYAIATLNCITLDDSKFIQEYKNKISNWSQYWRNTCTNLVWHENQEIVFRK